MNGQKESKWKILHKCIMANTSAIWQQSEYTIYQLSSPSCSSTSYIQFRQACITHTHAHTHTNMHTHMHTQANHTQILQNKLNDLIKRTPPFNWEENQNQRRHSPQSSLLPPQTEEWSAKHVHWRPPRSSLVKGYPLPVRSSLSHTCSAKQEDQSLVLSNQRRKTQSGERHTGWADDVSWQRQQCWIKVH